MLYQSMNIEGENNMRFKESLQLHLDAIMTKDLDSFSSTISESITLIMMNGTIIRNRQKVIEFHKEWFSDEDWKLSYEIIKIDETEKMAYVLLAISYEDVDMESKPVHIKYYLNLIFKKYEENWLLEFDQNTVSK